MVPPPSRNLDRDPASRRTVVVGFGCLFCQVAAEIGVLDLGRFLADCCWKCTEILIFFVKKGDFLIDFWWIVGQLLQRSCFYVCVD